MSLRGEVGDCNENEIAMLFSVAVLEMESVHVPRRILHLL